jgi:hypothetical protein
MHTAHFWHQFNLYWKKIIFIFLSLIFLNSGIANGQIQREINLPDSDEKWLRYGFVLGGHFSRYRIKYSADFVQPSMDTVQSIQAPNLPGFSLGFLLNLRLAKYADLRLMPKVGFYEHELIYTYTNRENSRQMVESTIVEFPLLLKYKSARRGNVRMYMVGGVNPTIKASGKKDREDRSEDRLLIKNTNLAIEYGFGFDLYYPLFKFSPEIRFSHGLINLLRPEQNNIYGAGLNSVTAHSVSLYLIFSD